MCGRYRLSRRKQIIEEYFASTSEEQEWEPRYNIAPTQSVPIVRQNPKEPHPGSVASPLGTGSVMGERSFCRCQDDQRKIGNGGHEARIL